MRPALILWAVFTLACSVTDPHVRCGPGGACPGALECYEPPGLGDEPGYCVQSTTGMDGGRDAGRGDAGDGDVEACVPTGDPEQICNRVDDDCDGEIDEARIDRDDQCGDCTTECPGSDPFCRDGTCVNGCDGTEMICDGSCVDVQIDEDRCGDCETQCPDLEVCMAGACRCGASPTCTTFGFSSPACCGDSGARECVDLDSPENCGQCGRECARGATCVGQACRCSGGEECYGGRRCDAVFGCVLL